MTRVDVAVIGRLHRLCGRLVPQFVLGELQTADTYSQFQLTDRQPGSVQVPHRDSAAIRHVTNVQLALRVRCAAYGTEIVITTARARWSPRWTRSFPLEDPGCLRRAIACLIRSQELLQAIPHCNEQLLYKLHTIYDPQR